MGCRSTGRSRAWEAALGWPCQHSSPRPPALSSAHLCSWLLSSCALSLRAPQPKWPCQGATAGIEPMLFRNLPESSNTGRPLTSRSSRGSWDQLFVSCLGQPRDVGAGWWGPCLSHGQWGMWSDELTSQVRGLRSTEETWLGQGHTACKNQSQVLKKKKPGLGLKLWSLLFLVLAERTALQSSPKEEIPKAVAVTLCSTEPQRALRKPTSTARNMQSTTHPTRRYF